MATIFVKQQKKDKVYFCSWDDQTETLSIQTEGCVVKSIPKLSFRKAWKELEKFFDLK